MVFHLITRVGKAAEQGPQVAWEKQLRPIRKQAHKEGRSIRHTVAEAAALIGVIPLLALGYVVVRYVLPVQTNENILLLILFVSVLLFLGIQQIRQLTKRILTVAAGARRVRQEMGPPPRDLGIDEIGDLSTDLSAIASTLSTRASELQETREFLSHLFERLPHPLLAVSSSGVINLANPAAARLLQYEGYELIGMNITSIFEDRKDAEKLLESGQAVAIETLWRKKDGTQLPVSVCSDALSQDGWGGHGTVVVGTDLTDRKQLEEQLRHSQKMEAIGLMAGGIAHDFNNILTIIKGHGYFLMEGIDGDSPMRVDLENIQKAIDRASGLTYQLLAFSKKQVLKPQVLNLNTVTGSMDKLLRRLLGEDIEIVSVLAPDLCNAKADRSQMEQVIVNLAINARDAMPRGGRLIIETANVIFDRAYCQSHPDVLAARYVLLSVSDTGCGIREEVKARIFEPFFTTKKLGQGSGLGLSTVYGIVKQHGGHIYVYSEEGKGTSFKMYLPCVDEEAESEVKEPQRGELPRGDETVLLVEDDENILKIGLRALRSQGYMVLTAENGEEALELAGKFDGRIDLLVTDVIMPVLGGKGLAEQLTRRRGGLKTIFTSGYTNHAISFQTTLGGDFVFMQKPYTIDTLLVKVREVLDAGQ